MSRQIVIASENEGKIREVKDILREYEVLSLKDFDIKFDVIEDGKTFKENAMKKAEWLSKKLNGKVCIADDSGIEIEILDGFPGVTTKRWLAGTDRERNNAILKKMQGLPKEKRKIKFIVAVAISDGNKTITYENNLEGYVSNEVRGNNGFGFDEIFELENGKTLAEISEEEKNIISPRKKALDEVKNFLLHNK